MHQHQAVKTALEADWAALERIPVNEALCRLAGSLAERYALRGYDAVHLATALVLRRQESELVFLSFDDKLSAAATAAQLSPYVF